MYQIKFSTIIIIFLLAVSPALVIAQIKPPYAIFTAEGKTISYNKMIKSLGEADIVFFGELHDNALGHWLELQVLKDLYAVRTNITIGMEMFEADNQLVFNEHQAGLIEEKHFLKEAKIWDNYKTDYKPLVNFAIKAKLPVIATNVPRRYASLVYRKGVSALDSLTAESKQWIAPLPLEVDYTLTSYQAMMEGMGQHGSGTALNLVASQALKDATMAHFILKYKKPNDLFYHLNGAYHSQDKQGIIYYIRKTSPEHKIITIHTTTQPMLDNLDPASKSKADFIIAIADDMTSTY